VFKSEAGDLDTAFADNRSHHLSRAPETATGSPPRWPTSPSTSRRRGISGGTDASSGASTLADNLGYQNLSAGLRQNLGLADLIDGDPRHARRHFLDSLDTARITGVTSYLPGAILGLALAAGADGDPAIAATLHGVADEHYEQAGRNFEALEAGLRDRDRAQLRAALGDAAFEAAYARGRTLSQADATALAVRHSRPRSGAASAVTVPAAGRRRAVQQACCRNETGDSGAAGRRGDRRPDRRAVFLSVNTVRSHLERIRTDRRPPARGSGPLRHPGCIEAVTPSA